MSLTVGAAPAGKPVGRFLSSALHTQPNDRMEAAIAAEVELRKLGEARALAKLLAPLVVGDPSRAEAAADELFAGALVEAGELGSAGRFIEESLAPQAGAPARDVSRKGELLRPASKREARSRHPAEAESRAKLAAQADPDNFQHTLRLIEAQAANRKGAEALALWRRAALGVGRLRPHRPALKGGRTTAPRAPGRRKTFRRQDHDSPRSTHAFAPRGSAAAPDGRRAGQGED